MFDFDQHLSNADWVKQTDDSMAAVMEARTKAYEDEEDDDEEEEKEDYRRALNREFYRRGFYGKDFKEGEHPRDEGGKFSEKEGVTGSAGGSGMKKAREEVAAWVRDNPSPPHTIVKDAVPPGTPNRKQILKELRRENQAEREEWDRGLEDVRRKSGLVELEKQERESKREKFSEKFAPELSALEWAQSHAGKNRDAKAQADLIRSRGNPFGSIWRAWYPGAAQYVIKQLKRAGAVRTHTSGKSSARGSVYYEIESPTGKEVVRVSDHELPDTDERVFNRGQGRGGQWHEVILDHVVDPEDIDDQVSSILEDMGLDTGSSGEKGTRDSLSTEDADRMMQAAVEYAKKFDKKQFGTPDVVSPPKGAESLLTDPIGTSRSGECYESAGQFMMESALTGSGLNATMIHGTVSMGDQRIGHGWVEIGDVVYDGTHTQFFDRDSYREFTEAETEHEYNWEECADHMARTEHWGPWEETAGLLSEEHYRPGRDE